MQTAERKVYPRVQVGDVFGEWTILGRDKATQMWRARCSCGRVATVYAPNLQRGQSKRCKKCGTKKAAAQRRLNGTDGRTHGADGTPTYRAWISALQRCYNPNSPAYPDYGGRGITVCDRWRFGEDGKGGFECFFEDMGERLSPKHSLDRFPDPNGRYGPKNCRWATKREQNNNRRNTVFVVFNGVNMPLADAAREAGVPYNRAFSRIRNGWTVERALSTPALKIYPRRAAKGTATD